MPKNPHPIRINWCPIGQDYEAYVFEKISDYHNPCSKIAPKVLEGKAMIAVDAVKMGTSRPGTITFEIPSLITASERLGRQQVMRSEK